MEDKIILEELTKEKLAQALKDLEPGTLLIIDMPREKKITGFAVSTLGKKGDETNGGTL